MEYVTKETASGFLMIEGLATRLHAVRLSGADAQARNDAQGILAQLTASERPFGRVAPESWKDASSTILRLAGTYLRL